MSVSALLLFFVAEGALQLRIYVMYGCDRRLAVVNGVFFAAQMVLMMALTILDVMTAESERVLCGEEKSG